MTSHCHTDVIKLVKKLENYSLPHVYSYHGHGFKTCLQIGYKAAIVVTHSLC